VHIKKRLLLGYLLIAYIVVQSISGFLHMHSHDSSHEPDVAHHHYPALSFSSEYSFAENSDGLVVLNLQSDGLSSCKVFSPLLAIILLTTALLLTARKTGGIYYSLLIFHLTRRLKYRIPPLRAPPLQKI